MVSKWIEWKEDAVALRKKGASITRIEKELGIPRSTLSGWLKGVILTKKQRETLGRNRYHALIKARKAAVLWHNQQKQERLRKAENDAGKVLDRINSKDKDILELALAILYLGEGFKRSVETAIGSSDPLTLKFFLTILSRVYNIDISKIRCELYLRADQSPRRIIRFWAKELGLPLTSFKQINVDRRTIGSKTYPNYHGVCSLRCGNVAIQRKLVFLGNKFFEKTVKEYARLA